MNVAHRVRFFAQEHNRPTQALVHNHRVVDVAEVYLLRIDHVSRGSLQPILAIRSGT